jgi:hypothetical protein
MSERRHTPSPWTIHDFTAGVERRRTRIEIHGPTTSGRGFHPVCTIPSGFTNQMEDAALIAAAPEMAAMLRRVLETCHMSEDESLQGDIEALLARATTIS